MILKFVHENSFVKSNYIQQIPVLYLLTIMGILWYKVLYSEIQWWLFLFKIKCLKSALDLFVSFRAFHKSTQLETSSTISA